MLSDDELMCLVEKVTSEYKGDIDKLSQVIGLLVLCRLFGWRVMRIVAPQRNWALANKLFGDVKSLSVERGMYYDKSVGLRVIDKVGDYWDYVNRVKQLPLEEKRGII